MTIIVKPNTFWKKQVVTEGINVSPKFTDFSQASATSFSLAEGSAAANAFVLSGSVPDRPTYGSGELRGGFLRMYSTAIETEYNREAPVLTGYAIDKSINIREGGYTFAKEDGDGDVVGNKLLVYNSCLLYTSPSPRDS
mgnify:CR=1 FL=1